MIKFPEILPAPSQDFNYGNETNSIRTTMESGLVRQRKTHLFNRYTASIKWELSAEEYEIFLKFLELEASGGMAWFEAPLYTVNSIAPHKIRLVNGVFQSSYQSWGGWAVSATADIEKLASTIESDYWLSKDLENGVSLFTDIIDSVVNQRLPSNFLTN